MATRANGATAKDATTTRSNVSILRNEAPQLRTSDAIVAKYEQIQDGLERQTISGKVAEQMNQTLKGITNVASLEMRFWTLLAKFGRKAPVPPVADSAEHRRVDRDDGPNRRRDHPRDAARKMRRAVL